ncbi:hypothetical protein KVP09_09645 [Alcaligenaceae bacterium CGII-47]|nr:hypothetical protein [Alcaligenaceae bacterium CGII-47]
MRIGIAMLCLAVAGLTACSTTGNSFDPAGLNHIVEGRTTLAQASQYLGTPPVDTWRRNDGSVLARWAYKGTIVTDALYVRQEAWLLFGADGSFERTDKTINTPPMNHTRTLAEVQREEAEQAARDAANRARLEAKADAKAQAAMQDDTGALSSATGHIDDIDAAQTSPVAPLSEPTISSGNALLPTGTTYTPGVSYPIPPHK